VLKKNKRRNVVEEQEWCQGGVGGVMSRKNMNNIEEEQKQKNVKE